MLHSLTIGNFDGVHLGHRVLIERVLELSRKNPQSTAAVLSFEPHPREFLGIRPIPERLCSVEEKQRRIECLGIKKFFIQNFDEGFSNLSAEDFLEDLEKKYAPKNIVVGKNFFFGKNRGGNPTVLQNWGSRKGVHVEVIEPLEHDGIIVSSTEIRIHIQSGNIELANKICGFEFSLPQEHIPGDARGRNIGFPTLNSQAPRMQKAKYCLPPHGVYVTRIRMGERTFPSITNFGIRPTFHNATEGEFFETHVLSGWEDRLSSKHFAVDFIDRIRPEQRFADQAELVQRIQEDIRIARLSHGL